MGMFLQKRNSILLLKRLLNVGAKITKIRAKPKLSQVQVDAKLNSVVTSEQTWKEELTSNQIKTQTHRISQIIAQKNKLIHDGFNPRPFSRELYLMKIRDRYAEPKTEENMNENPDLEKRAKKRKLVVEVQRIKNKKVKYRREIPTIRLSNAKSPYWAHNSTPKSYIVNC